MRALLIQHGCEAALEVLPADMEAQTKTELNKKAHSAVILCLGNKVLREVIGEATAAGHIDEFNKIVFDLANIEVKFEEEDLALLLLTSLPASYGHFVDTLLYKREALTLEDVMTTLNSKEIKERSKAKGDDGEGLDVRGRTDRRDSRQSRGKSRSKSRGGRLKYYICKSDDHLKRNCPKNNRKKSTCYVKKDEQPSSSGSTYDDSEVMMVMSAQIDWIMDSGCSYHMTPRLDILFNFLEYDEGTVQLSESCAGLAQKTRTYQRGGTTGAGKAGDVWQEKSRFKHKAFGKFKKWKQLVENQTERTVKKLRTNNGLEFCNREFEQLCIESGIARHVTVAGTPQQNGLAELSWIRLDDESSKMVTSRNVVFNESVMYKNTLKDSRAGADKFVEELHVEVELQRLNNHTPEEDQTDQEDGNDEDAGDQSDTGSQRLSIIQLGKSKLVSCKWLFKIKEGIEGVQKPRYKARLVAHGFTQRAGIDYNEVFSPVVRHASIRVILALTACKDYEMDQLDVKTVFLHGNLEEVIYMRQPPGYEKGNKVCLLKKSLYGLKQSPRQWYKRFDEYMLSNGFKRSNYDSCVYYRSYAPSEYIYLLLYVDDMLIACKSKAEIGSTKSLLKKEFDMKELGEAKKILDNEKSVQMPLGGHFKLSLKDCPVRDCDVERMSKVLYANAVGSLMYLMVCMRLDIAYAVSLVYGTDRGNHVDVTGFVDSDYAKDPNKEYMALTEAVKEAIWLRGLLKELGVELNTVAVNCDNQCAIHLSRNHVFHERTKHINVRYHFIREVLEAKTIKVLKVGIEHNAADALTKANRKPKVEIVRVVGLFVPMGYHLGLPDVVHLDHLHLDDKLEQL
ncbi:retrovirus-related pol polyprotein from transposon TNT 1-94 [Tanacetum coccineum]|uniref:Retrovirus-related pol polyprotein from transposon TNT 1-94 n=1 Tax=Tanacetum coccineum TaxID=301880 RepID=A0ABQ5A717_9ASTR